MIVYHIKVTATRTTVKLNKLKQEVKKHEHRHNNFSSITTDLDVLKKDQTTVKKVFGKSELESGFVISKVEVLGTLPRPGINFKNG